MDPMTWQIASPESDFIHIIDFDIRKLQLIPSYSSNPTDRSSPKTKNRPMASNPPTNLHQGQQQIKMFVNNPTNVGVSGDNVKRNMPNKPMFNKNVNSTITNASSIQKNVTTTGTFFPFVKPFFKREM